ncbi:MAG TPA: hypothetical protein VLX33_01810 [Nitrososphaerales archaeon]|nr:hypothetical protein [Nitrososphaerales archaeon]
MEILEGAELKRRMLESYARNPRGWSFTVSPSLSSGFFDATVAGPDGAWMLKLDSLFKPSPIVIGSQAEALRRRRGGPFPYGYRDLPPELALRLMGGGEEVPIGPVRRRLLSVLESDPIVPQRGGSYAEGPLVFTGPGSVSLSDKQKEVDARLASEMRRLLRLRYPAYG